MRKLEIEQGWKELVRALLKRVVLDCEHAEQRESICRFVFSELFSDCCKFVKMDEFQLRKKVLEKLERSGFFD